MPPLYDVAIIGGGPAGSTAAILLAQKGRKVVVLEKEKFPRFHIGESLLPYSMSAFDRLGIRPWLDETAFPKHGGEIATACGTRAVKFYFKEGFRLRHHSAYQVERATFDKMLLDRAIETGAEVREETGVETIVFAEDGATVNLTGGEQIRARYVLDGSGRNSVIGRQFNLKIDYAHLRKFSCFSQYEQVQRDGGIDAGLTRLVRADRWWFWLIPLDERRTSVGVVMESAEFKTWKCTPEEALARAIDETPIMRLRMAEAARVSPVHAASDYSYRNSRLTGDRWMMAGDAAGFIDPIFSTGVFLAVYSGEMCADALEAVLDHPGRQPALFRRYERTLNGIMNMYLRFVTAWYRSEFVEVFTTPTQRFELAPAVNSVLAGNIGNSFAIWWRMQLFYLVLYVQRFFPLCPRLARTGPSNLEQVHAA
jgi:flavin-dependent dehydrogenase